MSRMIASGFTCGISANAILPLAAGPTISKGRTSFSVWRTTTESSTTKTLSFRSTLVASHAKHRKLLGDHLLGERLHQIFVGAGLERASNMLHVTRRGDHHQLDRVPGVLTTHGFHELDAVHHGHIPIDETQIDRARTFELRESQLAVARLEHLETKLLDDAPDDRSHCFGIIDD